MTTYTVEDSEEWMQHNHRYERDGSSTKYTKVFDYGRVEYYVHQLTAAHAAELANLHAKIGDLLAISATAKEQGRREALMGMPVDALIYAALLLRLDTGNIESVVNSKTVSEYEREISRLVESARAAQQENKQ